MRRRCVAHTFAVMPRTHLIAGLLALAAAGPAQAATFHVAPGASDPCTPSTTCGSINAALAAARAAGGDDIVDLAAGAYTESLVADQAADAGVTLHGAGAAVTTVTAAAGTEPALRAGVDPVLARMTIRGIGFTAAPGSDADTMVLFGDTVLDRVEVTSHGGDALDAATALVTIT